MSRLKSWHSQANSDPDGSYFLTADFFLFFASPTVLMILDSVRKNEMTCLAISRKLGITPKAVLGKLRAMEREGILIAHARSRDTFYRVADSHIAKVFEQILKFPERNLKRASGSTKSLQTHGQREKEFSGSDSLKSVG